MRMHKRIETALRLGSLSALLLAAGCDLTEKPKSILAPENFYQTQEDAVSGVTGVYESLMGLYAWFFYLSELPSDDYVVSPGAGGDMHQLSQYNFTPTLWVLGANWGDSYRTINRANAVLDRIPAINMPEAVKARLLGEARFLRALTYFNLVRMYGDVPLIDREVKSLAEAVVARTPAEQVYALIVSDLEQAIQALPTRDQYGAADLGRASKGAAQALLAKVYLERKDYTNAARLAGEVINSGKYRLLADWKDNFRIALEFSNSESIFEIDYDREKTWGTWYLLFALPSNVPGGDAYGLLSPSPELVALFSEGDERGNGGTFIYPGWKDARGRTWNWTQPSGPAFNKQLDETSPNNMESRGWSALNNNWIVLRYADVLLTYAEAVAEGGAATAGSAEQRLNEVRVRAGAAPVSGLSPAALRQEIRNERRREFVFEGHRWFDLRRWGLLRSVKNAPSEFFPLPQSEIDLNPKLVQNSGW